MQAHFVGIKAFLPLPKVILEQWLQTSYYFHEFKPHKYDMFPNNETVIRLNMSKSQSLQYLWCFISQYLWCWYFKIVNVLFYFAITASFFYDVARMTCEPHYNCSKHKCPETKMEVEKKAKREQFLFLHKHGFRKGLSTVTQSATIGHNFSKVF